MDETYGLPTNGWRPGRPSHAAARSGPFHAVLTVHGAEAWLGDQQQSMTWPEGWRVGFEPTRLIDPTGQVFAHEGERLFAGGGLDDSDRFALTMIERKVDRDARRQRESEIRGAESDRKSRRQR